MRKTFLRRVCSVFMVLSFVLTQSGGVVPGLGYGVARASADTSILDERISFAQNLCDNAAEGTAKTNLQDAISDANDTKNNYPNEQGIIESAVITLNYAITSFQESIITEPADADEDGVGDVCEAGEETDTTDPVIILLGVSPVSVFVGSVYEDAGATASDNIDGDLTEAIEAVSTVNTAVAGNYTVSYNVSDAAGNEADQKTRNVNVIARENPNGGGAAIILAKFAPLNASIVINSGNEKTAIRNVALALSAENAEMMAIANDSGFADSSWEIYNPSKQWTLTEGNGIKTVYAKFKNASGTDSKIYTDEITLDGNGSDDNGSVLGDDTVGIYNGDLIQCKTSADPGAVYVVKIVGNKKFIRHIKSDFFKFYEDIVWSDVKEVASLDEYTVSKWVRINTGMNGTAKPTDKVYEINDDWTKHWLNMTTDQFFASGGSEEAIFSINQGELDSYTAGADVL